MRDAIFRFKWKSSTVPKIISLAAIGEKFPAYALQPGLTEKNHPGESETASFLPRKSESSAATLCNMANGVAPSPPTGESWNPVGAVRKKLSPLSEAAGWSNSELP